MAKKIAFCGRKLFDHASTKKMFKLVLKAIFLITECLDAEKCPGSRDKK